MYYFRNCIRPFDRNTADSGYLLHLYRNIGIQPFYSRHPGFHIKRYGSILFCLFTRFNLQDAEPCIPFISCSIPACNRLSSVYLLSFEPQIICRPGNDLKIIIHISPCKLPPGNISKPFSISSCRQQKRAVNSALWVIYYAK